MSIKRVLCPAQVRRIPPKFSWIDQRLVRHRFIGSCGTEALALYLFLVTVADAQGLSYYSDRSILSRLSCLVLWPTSLRTNHLVSSLKKIRG